MPGTSERDLSRIGWLDFVLTSVGSCLAVYSAGMSVGSEPIALFCIAFVVVGTLVSYGVRLATLHSPWIKLDAFFYAAGVLGSILFAQELRSIMPDEGFPREMMAGGWLCWMLILGSFATWQDSTLLFQAIPALALFGLIGCYDTFRGSTFAFFAYLICLATLFARAHGREMIRKAAESGYFTRGLAPGAAIPSVETTPGLALQLKRGPWRWVAGPEWALASATAVALISLLGAPVIRSSVAGVARFVKIPTPPMRGRSFTPSPAMSDSSGQMVRIGRPFLHGLSRPLLQAKMDEPLYLRSDTYDMYTGRGWYHSPTLQSAQGTPTPSEKLNRNQLKDPTWLPFQIQTLRLLKNLPLPCNASDLTSVNGQLPTQQEDGTYQLAQPADDEVVAGRTALPKPGFAPSDAYKGSDMSPYMGSAKIPQSIQSLARAVAAGGKDDYQKAQLISREISNRIAYNLDAPETPLDKDPVEYSLFTQKEGYCTAFASAMVLMARSVGLPARYVQGYLPDERRNTSNGMYVVDDEDYHAWAEVYFKNAGWVIFDPSVGAKCAGDGECLGDVGDNRPWYQKGPFALVLDSLIVLAGLGVCLLGLHVWRRHARGRGPKSDLERMVIQFNSLLQRASDVRRRMGQTPDEYVASIESSLGASSATARKINDHLVRAMYSAEEVDSPTIVSIRSEMAVLARDLKRLRKGAGR